MTIRRDLDVLVAQGVAHRVRGGAVSLLMQGEELPFLMRELDNAEAKRRIATLAASLSLDGEAVVVDSGTTGLAVAEVLVGRRLTVMPRSLQATAALSGSSSTTLVMPEGTARFGEGSLVGPMTEASLSSLRFDTAVLTCCGVSPDGAVTAHDIEDAAVKRAAHASSTRTLLVAEGAKFTRFARAAVCSINQVDVVVTDTEAPDSAIETMLAAGIQVHRA